MTTVAYEYRHSCGLMERYELKGGESMVWDFIPRCSEMGVAPDGTPCDITLFVEAVE